MTPKRTMWMTGAAIIAAVAMAWSPAPAAPRRAETAKEMRKLTEARRKAMESAAKQRRKTIAKRADAAVKVAKAQKKAAEAQTKAARASALAARRVVVAPRPVVVAPPARRLPHRVGPGIVIGGHDSKARLTIGLGGHLGGCTWISGRYVTRTERVLVEKAHYEWQTARIVVEPGRFEFRRVGPSEEILYDSQGNPHKVIVSPRGEKVWVEARYETRRTKVWVPDRYEIREVRTWEPGRWLCSGHSRHRSGFNLSALFRF